MSDFPVADFHKPVIASTSAEAIGCMFAIGVNGVGASAVWPAANRAIYVPFALSAPYLVNKVWWANGATVGNGTADCGVYSSDGTKLLSSGTTTTASASTIQSVTLGSTFLLTPDSYYMALVLSSASDTIWRNSNAAAAALQMVGMAQQASASPLPATFTLASVASAYMPLFGIASSTVI